MDYAREMVYTADLIDGEWETDLAVARVQSDNGQRFATAPTHYGFSHSPPDGSQCVVVRPDGNPTNNIAVTTHDRRTRVQGLQDGEVALNTQRDDPAAPHRTAPHRIALTNGGEVVVSADNTVFVRSGNVTLQVTPTRVFIEGDVQVNGRVTATRVITSEEDVVGGGVRLKSHSHPHGDPAGVTGAPL